MITALLLASFMTAPASNGRVVNFPTAAVFEPLLAPARYKGAFGGRGSGKSEFFGDLTIDDCLRNPGMRFVCIREVQKSLEQSVKRLLEDKIKQYDLTREFRIMDSRIETPGDGVIIFSGMQDHTAESIKSLKGFHRAWVEEAQSLSARSLKLLRPTIREPGSEIWLSWNPRHKTDPVDEMLRGTDLPDDSVVVQSNFRDNPWFPDVLRKELEWDRRRDPDKYEHIWLGGYEKHSHSRVFKNWRVESFETPADAVFLLGGDWGYSVDPTVQIRAFAKGKTLFVDFEAYEVGCEIDDTPALFDAVGCVACQPEHPCDGTGKGHGSSRAWPLVADSARPETISFLKRHGYPLIEAAVKGPNSVKEGIIFLQSYDIVVHPRCVHTIDELTMYSYVVDKLTGIVTNQLEDKKNHVIDSLRYAAEKLRRSMPDFVVW